MTNEDAQSIGQAHHTGIAHGLVNTEVVLVEIPGSERAKLTVLLPEQEMAALRRLAAMRNITLTDAVRRAIAMEQFIEETRAQGGKLLVELPDHTIRQLIVR